MQTTIEQTVGRFKDAGATISDVFLLEYCQDIDALVLPTAAGPAPLATYGTGDAWFLSPWTALGFPAINLPIAFTPDHLPLGMQLVAKPNEDYQLLQFGARCEHVVGRLEPPEIATRN